MLRCADLPADFRETLQYCWKIHRRRQDLPERLRCRAVSIVPYQLQLYGLLGLWTAEDWRKVDNFIQTLRNPENYRQVPPLIVSGGCCLLRDGFHRLLALLVLGIREWPCIDLDAP